MLTSGVRSARRSMAGRCCRWYSAITEESDFAFRKTEIGKLKFADQDRLYYPTITTVENELKDKILDKSIAKIRIPAFRKKYEDVINVENVSQFENVEPYYMVSGKIKSIRKAGKGSYFMDIVQDFTKLQLIVHHKIIGIDKTEFLEKHESFRPGDQIMGIGKLGITKVGELSVKLIKPLKLISPSLHPLPPKFNDIGKINSNKVVDYLVNGKKVILLRIKIIQLIRRFLENDGFINVETPILCNGNSGANAKPFETSSQYIEEGKKMLSLRVAPELWLKKLIIAGFDQIYEIGKNFRNEGIDSTHNPEFTSCEFYKTFTSLEELMEISENMIKFILSEILLDDSMKVFHENCQRLTDKILHNDGKFKKIDFIEHVQKKTGVKFESDKLDDKEQILKVYESIGLQPQEYRSWSELQLINKLSEDFVEVDIANEEIPVFIYNIPEVISPLAKSTDNKISRRFEMYIKGKEFINAYEEENNPFKQHYKFELQQKSKEDCNEQESILPDYRYVEMMEWGMPSTGGWGLGVDRLVMELSGSPRIEQVLPFGRLNDVLKQ